MASGDKHELNEPWANIRAACRMVQTALSAPSRSSGATGTIPSPSTIRRLYPEEIYGPNSGGFCYGIVSEWKDPENKTGDDVINGVALMNLLLLEAMKQRAFESSTRITRRIKRIRVTTTALRSGFVALAAPRPMRSATRPSRLSIRAV
ncbi:unnamed protein product [Peronospora destructor]|uniref:Uncharacterized protein n=1 Tax=Peronospora destructor TaxID=86335 RepID=A0AAV0VHI3_9STRA|nr:unnamed protein product [Peronospora destructor]